MKTCKYIINANAPISEYYQIENAVYTDENGVECVPYFGLSLTVDEYLKQKSNDKPELSLKLISSEEFDTRIQLYKEECIKEEEFITEDSWWWYFECLPPCRWTTTKGVEIFHLSERLYDNLVQWVGKIDDNFYKLVDVDSAESSYIAQRFINLDKKRENKKKLYLEGFAELFKFR